MNQIKKILVQVGAWNFQKGAKTPSRTKVDHSQIGRHQGEKIDPLESSLKSTKLPILMI